MRDPFAWDPNGTREAWFERSGTRLLKPITREGRLALMVMVLGFAATIPLLMAAALAGAHVAVLVVVLLVGMVGVPAWFLWTTLGRVKV